ncbi:MAG TPA: GTP 3',8-cyclase MoaA [Candidatus Thermoplasmatota archaeon]
MAPDAPRDRFNRPMENLRISITQRCGMSCAFCHAEGQFSAEDVVSPEQIETAVRVGREFGIRQVKLSGGEPMLRRELAEIVERSKRWADEVSMVTTGTSLAHQAGALKDAGLDRVNISVHSPDDETHSRILGARVMDRVRQGIAAAKEAGLGVRLNMTLMKGVNDTHWRSMLDYCAALGVDLRLIEIHAPRHEVVSPYFRQFFVPIGGIEAELRAMATAASRRPMHNRPVFRVEPEGAERPVEVEVVRPQFNPAFCAGCTRVRLTSDGKLKTCLLRRDDLIGIEECHGPTDSVRRMVVTEDSVREAFGKALAMREPYWKPGETLESVAAAYEGTVVPLTPAQSGPGLKVVQ